MNEQTTNTIAIQDGLLQVVMAKNQVGPELVKLKSQIVKISEEQKQDMDILVDVSKVETSDDDANQIARKFFEGLPFRRMAVYGGSYAVNVGIRLIVNLFLSRGVGEVKIFKTEDKAKDWIDNKN